MKSVTLVLHCFGAKKSKGAEVEMFLSFRADFQALEDGRLRAENQ